MKQVVVVRGDLDIGRGKTAAQVAHASLGAYRKAGKKEIKQWKKKSEKKVVVEASDEDELLRLKGEADDLGLSTYLVKDAGKTEISKGTTTALAIGPGKDETIDKVTSNLTLLK